MSRINNCRACKMIEQGVKSRIALKHTCGKEPAEPKCFCSTSNQKNPYATRQTLIEETLAQMKNELTPEEYDRLLSSTEHWIEKCYGVGFKELFERHTHIFNP